MPVSNLVIQYRPLTELRPFPGNARAYSKRQREQLQAAIKAHGFLNPVLIDEHGELIAGHGRWQAAKAVGLETIPTIELAGLSDRQKAKIRLADNQIPLNAAWDMDLLRIEFELIQLDSPSAYLEIGFEPGRIDAIMADAPKPIDDDRLPALAGVAVSRPGDIWMLGVDGRHRLGCGDCRDRDFLAAVMAGKTADAAFTDPPYGIPVNGFVAAKGRHREFAMGVGEMTPKEFTKFLADSLAPMASVTKDGGIHFICMDHRHVGELDEACHDIYDRRLSICVWDKEVAGMGSLYRSQHELIFVQKVGKAPYFNAVELGKHGRSRTTVWRYPGANSGKGSRRQDLALHPTVKPVQLVSDAIQDVTRRGDLVADAFMGSGTTLLSCERTGRRCFGIEIDPLYVDLAVQRFMDLFGGEAILEATGQTFAAVRLARQPVAGAESQ